MIVAVLRRLRPVALLVVILAGLALGAPLLGTIARGSAALVLEALPCLLLGDFVAAVAARARRPDGAARLFAAIASEGACCRPDGSASPAWAPVMLLVATFAFGWQIALLRGVTAVAIGRLASRELPGAACGHGGHSARGSAERVTGAAVTAASRTLIRVAIAGALASLAGATMGSAPGWLAGSLAPAFLLGALAGTAGPCGIGSVALAAAFARISPGFAAGILSTAGIVSTSGIMPRPRRYGVASLARPAAISRAEALAFGSVCLVAAATHGAGLLSPRLVPLLLAGSVAGFVTGIAYADRVELRQRRNPSRAAIACPLAIAFATAVPATPPVTAFASTIAEGAPGERFAFTGRLTRTGQVAFLERWQIWCCVADAAPIDVPLARTPALTSGSWIRAEGHLVRTARGLALEPDRIQRIAPPADPYVYA